MKRGGFWSLLSGNDDDSELQKSQNGDGEGGSLFKRSRPKCRMGEFKNVLSVVEHHGAMCVFVQKSFFSRLFMWQCLPPGWQDEQMSENARHDRVCMHDCLRTKERVSQRLVESVVRRVKRK